MKHKTIKQLRDSLKKVLKRGRPGQLKKLRKAYHGKRLKKWWSDYANAVETTIVECKNIEGVRNNGGMKGGHTHNHARNVLERKLNRSKESRTRCHNYLNKGFEYTLIRCNNHVFFRKIKNLTPNQKEHNNGILDTVNRSRDNNRFRDRFHRRLLRISRIYRM